MIINILTRRLWLLVKAGHLHEIFILILLAATFCIVPPGFAETGPPKNGQSALSAVAEKGAIHIKSDLMEAMDQKGTVVFTGHVSAVRDDLTIDSDRLEVFYSKQDEKEKTAQDGKKAIDKIVATGHVRITKTGRVATAEKAVYDKQAEKITLTGSAQVWEGPNRVKGDTIILFINENRSVVQSSGTKKVEAVVYPSE